MIVEAFLHWAETAKASERAKAASALSRAYLQNLVPKEQRNAALSALSHLVNDPSPIVRRELARAMCHSSDAPRHIVWALAQDCHEIGEVIIGNSAVLTDDDLIELLAVGHNDTHCLIAQRDGISVGICAAICEIGAVEAVAIILGNPKTKISRSALLRATERFGDLADMRGLILDRQHLSEQVKHRLLCDAVNDLSDNDGLLSLLGETRLRMMLDEAVDDGILQLIESSDHNSVCALIDQLSNSDQLTVGLLLKAAFLGYGEFLTRAVSLVSTKSVSQVRQVFVQGRAAQVQALMRNCGFTKAVCTMLTEMVLYWRHSNVNENMPRLLDLLRRTTMQFDDEEALLGYVSMLERLSHQQMFKRAQANIVSMQLDAA